MDDDIPYIPYLLLTPGPLTASRTVRRAIHELLKAIASVQRDMCFDVS